MKPDETELLGKAVLLADDCGAALVNCGLHELAARCTALRAEYDGFALENDVESEGIL